MQQEIDHATEPPRTAVGRRVLVVEDDPSLRESLVLLLGANGFAVDAVDNGAVALRSYEDDPSDVLIADLMLPGMDGLELCRAVRTFSDVPLLILTARSDTPTLVAGLECGADDYLTKPFEAAELVARIRALLRRADRDRTSAQRFTFGDLKIDVSGYRLHKRGTRVGLSATEFRLLVELVEHESQVLTREVLLDRVWDAEYLGDSRLVDMAVKRLRDKIEDDPHDPRYVVTVRGVGYRFDAHPS